MSHYTVRAAATMHAHPDAIWDILTDYESLHPMIRPKGFSPLRIEKGGKGAGTVIRFSVRTLGMTQQYRGEVSTPEPGRVLVESYPANNTVTTFTVSPMASGQDARVQISSEINARPGVAGAIERVVTPSLMARLYREELGKLTALAESRSAQ
jgi:hypothetical protein